MKLRKLFCELNVCQMGSLESVDLNIEPLFLARTADEISLVCPTSRVPASTTAREDGWQGFAIEGPLDFALVGILAEISRILAEANVPLFAVSTFNTDYVLVKADHFERAAAALETAGHSFID